MTKSFDQTMAGRVVAHLENLPDGTKLTAAQLGPAIGVKRSLKGLNEALRRCDLLACEHHQREGHPGGSKTMHWFLADGVEVLPRRSSFPDIQPRPGPLFPGVYAQEVTL